MLVPIRVVVIARWLVLAHLQHREHAAHLNPAKGALASHHGHRVVRQRHLHFCHVGHAAFSHHHVVRYELGDFFDHIAVVYPNHGRHIMAHGVHGVVALVAMKCPIAFFVGHKLDLPHLPDCYVGRDFRPAPAFRGGAAIGSSDLKLMPVQMDRVVGHGEVAHPNANLVVQAHIQTVNAWKNSTVP